MGRQLGAMSGLAMALIVLNHSIHFGSGALENLGYPEFPLWVENFLSALQALGAFAVPTFLFVSGSFVAYAARGNPPRISSKFLISSLKNILVPYLFWSIVYYVFYYFRTGLQYTALGYLKNLLVGFPFHFIPLLIFFYLLSPFLILWIKKVPAAVLGVIAVYQVFLLNLVYPGILGFNFPEWSHLAALPVLKQTMAFWGIYFPLGMFYGLNTKRLAAWSRRFVWVFAILSIGLFTIGAYYLIKYGEVLLAQFLSPVAFILIIPAIRREKIPFVRFFENIGKRSYGIYLMHIIIIEVVLIVIQYAAPAFFTLPILYFPLLYLLGLIIPLYLIQFIARAPTKLVYRYLFG